ncbi:MAG TPA: hypothetical protein V6D23_25880 [Candidatus Obscuribacterales bacterium]
MSLVHRPAFSHAAPAREKKVLKIGYVSPIFRHHAAAFFIEPLLMAHDRQNYDVFCYSDVKTPDAMTRRLQSLAGNWRETHGLEHRALAELIHRDQIDILVDLAGHTAHNRLVVFALKPAPVQVTFRDYPNTTGLSTIDYRLTDAWADPPGLTERFHTEELVRLPLGFSCYLPPESPAVADLPALSSGYVTFGSFNNLCKLSPATLDLWAGVLRAVPGSRLLLKSLALADAPTCQNFKARFAAQGIAAERLLLQGHSPTFREHLDSYRQVDIALDPFPYNGTTTTCEALWMGLPVVTLAGSTHVARVGVSLLMSLGLKDWIANTQEEYIALARHLAADPAALKQIRAGMRACLRASTLCDAERFTRSVEAAYRTMWQRWCLNGA